MSITNIKVCHPNEDDLQWVIQNMEKNLVSPFKSLNVKELFEISPWSLILKYDKENKAYAAFLDYPCENHYSQLWYEAIGSEWEKSKYHGVQTIFLHFLICEFDLSSCLENILKETFRAIPSLEWCCILCDGSTEFDFRLERLFYEDKSVETREFKFWSTNKSEYILDIRIRSKQSEDYLALKNMFSQIYGPFKNDSLNTFTLDFLDYGEDKCLTYKYFTFDDDNTYIGIADNNVGEAVGFIYATIQRVDLDLMNKFFQLESVYGLRKKHPTDKSETSFTMSSSDESLDEENEVREQLTDIIEEVERKFEIENIVNDILDQICGQRKTHSRRKTTENEILDAKILINSDAFNLANSYHTSLITQNLKHFSPERLVRLVNSSNFNVNNEIHMKLTVQLGERIKDIEPDRIREILNSDLFDPSTRDFSMVAIHVMSYMPEHKLPHFQRSEIGHELYEKLMYQKIKAREAEVTKTTKKRAVVPKLSFKDTQILLHYTKKLKREKVKSENVSTCQRKILSKDFKHIHYRNMGFISGLTLRRNYGVQDNYSDQKIKESSDYEEKKYCTNAETKYSEDEMEQYQKYPVPDFEKEISFIQEIPRYNGGTNSFYVEQFAIENEYQYQSLHIIMSSFAYFPRVDYCMLLLPYGTKQVPYLRSHFSAIPVRPFTSYDRELFVFYKTAFNQHREVRIYSESDFTSVKRLIQCSCLKDYLLEDLEKCLSSKETKKQAVVLVSDDQVFGVAVVEDIKELGEIKKKYDVAQRINIKYHKHNNQGFLLHCVIHPIFKYFSNTFLKEIMRLCQKSILYYKIYPAHLIPRNPCLWQSVCNVFEYFAPLQLASKVKRLKSYIVINTAKEKDTNNETYQDKYFCLCYTCTKLVLKDPNINSSRIVIIGDACLSLGILESLICREGIRYTNITIITKLGLPGEYQLSDKCYSFLPIDTDYTKSKLDSLCLTVWVTIIKGEVSSILNNSLKMYEFSGSKSESFNVGFDYLVICSDLEFQTLYVKPATKKSLTNSGQRYPLLNELNQISYTIAKYPSNVFSVNNAYEAAKVLNWLWSFFLKKVEKIKQAKKRQKTHSVAERNKQEERIIVYGNHLEAYTALAVLITEEFPLSQITFVKGPSDTFNSTFHSKFIEEAVDHVLKLSKLDLYTNATIEYDKDADRVRYLYVKTEEDAVRLDCCALLLCHEKNVNYNSFKTFHNSALSFTFSTHDSKRHPYLLINSNFQTNIKNIFAVGTTTEMYTASRKFARLEDSSYNKREVGMLVGENVNTIIANDCNLPELEFPLFTDPVVTYAKLPNGYFYILIQPPSACLRKIEERKVENAVEKFILSNLKTGVNIIPAPVAAEESDLLDEDASLQEKEMYQEFLSELRDRAQEQRDEIKETLDVERVLPDEPDYFGLCFNENEILQTIECLTRKDIDINTLKHLYGLELSQLNKIIQRVKRDSDIIYFRLTDGWILPLDHVTFEEGVKPRKRGFDSYWRLGYPREIKKKLNEFLDSFVIHKDK